MQVFTRCTITANEADAVTASCIRGTMPYDAIPQKEQKQTTQNKQKTQTKTKNQTNQKTHNHKKSSGRMGTNPVRKQGHCDPRQTPGGSTCPLSQGWWSDADRNRLGSATTRSAGPGRSARPVPPGDQEGLR